MSEKNTEKEREKIESKGAYSFDLHDAIRDVRKALGSGSHPSVVKNQLDSLFDILAPEIREAVNDRWEDQRDAWSGFRDTLSNLSKDRYWRLSLDGFEDSPWFFRYPDEEDELDHKVVELIGRSDYSDFRYECVDRGFIVSDGERSFFVETEEEADEKEDELSGELKGQLPNDEFEELRILFRIVVDALDNHGELRKWRDVEYGKV